MSHSRRVLLGIGILGGLTTYSTFRFETIITMRDICGHDERGAHHGILAVGDLARNGSGTTALISGGRMVLEGEGRLLCIFISESDKYGHRPLYDAILLEARKLGMAGATVSGPLPGLEPTAGSFILRRSCVCRRICPS